MKQFIQTFGERQLIFEKKHVIKGETPIKRALKDNEKTDKLKLVVNENKNYKFEKKVQLHERLITQIVMYYGDLCTCFKCSTCLTSPRKLDLKV